MKAMGRFHILMEKPMTTDLEEADQLTHAALKCDKIFMLNNTANFRESAVKVHKMVKSPRLKCSARRCVQTQYKLKVDCQLCHVGC